MAANQRSFAVTEAYRARFSALTDQAQRFARTRYRLDLEDLDGSYEPYLSALAAAVTQLQSQGVRLSSAYLSAYISSELGRRVSGPVLSSSAYAGVSRDGRPLSESLISPLIGVKAALKDGKPTQDALRVGLDRALRAVEMDTAHAIRQSLLDGITADDRFDGWRRAIRGTCGACASVASGLSHAPRFPVHPSCQCVSEPSVKGVGDRFPRPSGSTVMAAKSPEEQDAALGPEAAEAFRNGLPLESLVGHSAMENEPDLLTQRPLSAVAQSHNDSAQR